MEEQRDDLQLSSVSDTESMDKVFVFGCPYLGTLEDSDTSLAYPSPANHCFRPESPTSIELGHQETYCLSDQHHTCHVFQMAGGAGAKTAPVLERKAPKKRRRRVSLYALPLILVLILLAAIIWWPAPGTTIQESLVRGAQNVRDINGGATLNDTPLADPVEIEVVDAGTVDDSAGAAASSALDADDQQQDAVVREGPADAAGNRQTADTTRAEGSTLVSDDQAQESQAASARPAETGAPSIAAAVAEDQATVELLAETEANIKDEGEAAAENEAEIVVEDAGEGVATSSASAEASTTDNFEAEDPSFAEIDVTILEEPVEEDLKKPLETVDEDAEESERLLTSDLPVISTDVTPVSSPPVENISSGDAGERVVLIGPVARRALSLGDNSDEPNSLLVYQQPGDGAILAELENKQFVTLLGRDVSGVWFNVRLQDGREGWISASDSGASGITSSVAEAPVSAVGGNAVATATSYPIIRSAYVDTGALNLRTGPGVEYEAFTIIGKGQIVGLIGRRTLGPWVRVRLDDGTEGWVNSSLLAPLS